MRAIERLSRDLGLPPADSHSQDWAYELPDPYRTDAWLDRYLAAYHDSGYPPDVRHALMTLALDVSNDLLGAGARPDDRSIAAVLAALSQDRHEHHALIEYWALEGEPFDDCFALTPEVRKIKAAR
ncbi:hypothetical protein [Stenotrophomonas sp. ZAC14D2_NAIMI4_6]|uniref:hypothetical protein n=1 Tax=Stenotrophomonas sp. ZAC14D2_NAIMI4_6 TaxID=2072406 RepID=UPI000D54046D|nr:hypothetical protein [Stenotrophomonas sp. ZAC14D2_NAIMI4_6]AWH21213.1 hypothetical protein C1933_08265 [Stenotrophomonas sp. ZAC14D2_NAIMI4_6]